MAWITSNSVSVANGSKIVTVTGNVDLSVVDEGWAVQIGSNPIVEASSGTAPDGSGNSTLTLMNDWPNATAASATMSIIPNSGYQITLADRIKAILARTVEVMQLQHDYASQLGQVTATDPDTNEQHVYNTLRQNQQDMDDLLASLGTAAGYDVTSTSMDTGNGANGQPKLLKAGDFGGYGGNVAPSISSIGVNDLNNISVSSLLAAGVGNLNLPAETSVTVNTILRNADHGMQDVFTSNGQVCRYFRIKDGGVWLPYVESLHTGNTGSIVTEDYEEGIWSPSVYGSTTAGVVESYANRVGLYTKVGNVVTVSVFINGTFSSAPAGAVIVAGLPFVSNATAAYGGARVQVGYASKDVYAYTVNSQSEIFFGVCQGVNLPLSSAEFDGFLFNTSNFQMHFTLTYLTN